MYWGTDIRVRNWSPSGKYLVYEVNYSVCDQCVGDEKQNPNIDVGYYVADIFKGEVYHLPNLDEPTVFIPNTDKLINGGGYSQTFDLNSFKFFQSFRSRVINDGLNFSNDLHFLTYTDLAIGTGGRSGYSKIKLVDLNKKEVKLVADGSSYGEYQRPLLSKDGKWLSYLKVTSNYHTRAEDNTYVYDINENTIMGPLPGSPYEWTWDNRLILRNHNYDPNESSYILFNPVLQESKIILKYSTENGKILE